MKGKFILLIALLGGALRPHPITAQTIHFGALLRSKSDTTLVTNRLKSVGATNIKVMGSAVRFDGPKALNDSVNADFLEPYALAKIELTPRPSSKLKLNLNTPPTSLKYYVWVANISDISSIITVLNKMGCDSITVVNNTLKFVGPISVNDSLKRGFLKPRAEGSLDKLMFVESFDTPNAPRTDVRTLDWGLSYMHVQGAWDQGFTGAGYAGADWDTGFGPNSMVNVLYGRNWTDIPDSLNYHDDEADCGGHGTHTGGTIAGNAASQVGIAKDAKLVVGKAIDTAFGGGCGIWGSTPTIGTQYLIDHPELNVVAYNMSYGGTASPSDLEMQLAWAKGIVPCAAMGNSGANTPMFPAGNPTAIGISGISSDGTLAGWSNYGVKTKFSLPGNGITSLAVGNGNFAGKSGTSMATPHCTGAMVVIKQADPTLNADGMVNILCATADILGNPSDYGMPYHNPKMGCGSIRLDKAVYAATHRTTGAPQTIGTPYILGKKDSIFINSTDNWVAWSMTHKVTTERHGNYLVIFSDTTSWYAQSPNISTPIHPTTAEIRFGLIPPI